MSSVDSSRPLVLNITRKHYALSQHKICSENPIESMNTTGEQKTGERRRGFCGGHLQLVLCVVISSLVLVTLLSLLLFWLYFLSRSFDEDQPEQDMEVFSEKPLAQLN